MFDGNPSDSLSVLDQSQRSPLDNNRVFTLHQHRTYVPRYHSGSPSWLSISYLFTNKEAVSYCVKSKVCVHAIPSPFTLEALSPCQSRYHTLTSSTNFPSAQKRSVHSSFTLRWESLRLNISQNPPGLFMFKWSTCKVVTNQALSLATHVPPGPFGSYTPGRFHLVMLPLLTVCFSLRSI